MFIPGISVIIPVYNAAKTLDRCIISILEQSYRDFELILVNDGSTDGSFAICEKYRLLDSRVVVFSQKNAGASSARNRGLDNARGKYVTFVDSDDWVDSNYLESYHQACVGDSYDVIFTGIVHEYPDGNCMIKKLLSADARNAKDLADFIFQIHKQSMLGWVCNKIYRSEIIKLHNIKFHTEINIREDQLFTLDYLQFVDKAKAITVALYHYVDNSDSLSHKEKNYISYQDISLLVLQKFLKLPHTAESSLYYHQSYFQEYMVALGAIRRDNRYTDKQKRAFLEGCRLFIKTHRDLDLRFTSGFLKNIIKKLLFNYLPSSLLEKLCV